jgi:alpha-galactosidase
MVSSGMRDLGYSYVNIDDHWHAATRGPGGVPVADPTKFPDGIGAVADYVHDRGIKLGIYSDAGDKTCGGCFGGYGYEEIDARAYAEWGVDLLKYDYCHAPWSRTAAIARYAAMSDAIEASGRSIVFSACEWGFRHPWEWAHSLGASMWRTTPDIFENWSSVRLIAGRNVKLAEFAGPGHWNDPDMLLIGNRGEGVITSGLPVTDSLRIPLRGISDMQALTHMSLWAMMASPLLASNDPALMNPLDRNLLMNPMVLGINQDPLGIQARVVTRRRGLWVLRKPLADGRQAISFSNMGRTRRSPSLALASIGLTGARPVTDAWTMSTLGNLDTIEVSLRPYETRVFLVGPEGLVPTRASAPRSASSG